MLLFLLACSDTGFSTLKPDVGEAWPAISVTPDRLDFWNAGAGDVVVLPVTIWSVGETLLRVESVTIRGDASFTVVEGEVAFDLPSGASRDVEIAFSPLQAGDLAAEAVIVSDDPDALETVVALAGGGDVPSLVITPSTWDFGALPSGCADTVDLTLQNVGTDDLLVESWAFAGAGFSIEAERAPPFTLGPYDRTTATVTFAPVASGAADALLSVTSNDPQGIVEAAQSGEGTVAERGADTFESAINPPVDILFAVDQSASMNDDAVDLAGAFTSFIDTLSAATNSWNIGVVTTDTGCFNVGILDASTVGLTTSFTEAVALGDDRDILYDESLFQLVDTALRESAAGGCNEGFLRAGAPLHVIVVSDEPERSTEVASVWTWEWYLDRWYALVASDPLLRVSGIVDVDRCNEGATGYAEAIDATGGDALSICSGDWADRLSTLGGASLDYLWTFTLSEIPVEGSISVEVDGAARASGWVYDAGLNAVVMDTLTPGSTVNVAYDLASTCP